MNTPREQVKVVGYHERKAREERLKGEALEPTWMHVRQRIVEETGKVRRETPIHEDPLLAIIEESMEIAKQKTQRRRKR
jgi:hypothetical protein